MCFQSLLHANRSFLQLPYLLFGIFYLVSACVEQEDFKIQPLEVQEPEIPEAQLVGIPSLLSNLQAAIAKDGDLAKVSFEGSENYLVGYVISSDKSGNFFEELIIQNKASNPSAGIKILIDVNPLYTRYEFGRKIYIKLSGLALGIQNGVPTIGILSDNQIEKIPPFSQDAVLIRSPEVAKIEPKLMTLHDFSDASIHVYVKVAELQFPEKDVLLDNPLTFASESNDEFDGKRTLESCQTGGTIILETSTFSDFKGVELPKNKGSFEGVLSKNFFGDAFILILNEISGLVFDATERCEASLFDPQIESNTTFKSVYERFNKVNGYAPFGTDEADLFLEGYVISSDRANNFFDEIIIQNTPDIADLGPNNPRLGLRIIFDKNESYQTYAIGQKVYVRLNGLAVDKDSGSVTLGIQNSGKIEKIPEKALSNFLIAGEKRETITPLPIGPNSFKEQDTNTLVQLQNMQLAKNQVGLTYAGEAVDNFDGQRILEQCESTGSISVFTSTFSSFKSLIFPKESGNITAVLTNDFTEKLKILVIRNRSDIQFDKPRCDPEVLECDGGTSTNTNLFTQDFTEITLDGLSQQGWINENISGGSLKFRIGNFGNNSFAEITGFNTNEPDYEVWLVSPEVSITQDSEATLLLDVQANFDNGRILSLWITNSYAGTIGDTEWLQLDAVIPSGPSDGFGTFVRVGPIPISCLAGQVRFAFRYKGGDPGLTTRYHIDNVAVFSK